MKTPNVYQSGTRKPALLVLAAMMTLMTLSITAQPLVALSPQPDDAIPQSLIALLQRTGDTGQVAAARNSYQVARQEAVAAGYRGDLSFSLTPWWKTSWPADEDPDLYHEVSATIGTTIPTGLSAADGLHLERALARLQGAEAELSRVLLDTAATLYSSYAAVYIAWAEIPVLEAEYNAARRLLDAEEARYRGGEISLIDLFSVREDYRRTQQAMENGTTSAELLLLDLLVLSGSEIPHRFGSPEMIDDYTPRSPTADIGRLDVPPLQSALDRIDADHPRIAQQQAALDSALASTSVPRDPLLSTLRLSYSDADDQSGSISYSFARPSLSLSYTPPPIGIGTDVTSRSDRSSSDSNRNSITFQAVFSLGVGSARSHAIEAAEAAVRYEATRLEALERSLEADVRSRYRRIDSAEALLESARQALQRFDASLDAIRARDALGLAAPAEAAAAHAAARRAELAVTEAEINLVGAQLAYLATAYLPHALPASIYHSLFGGTR